MQGTVWGNVWAAFDVNLHSIPMRVIIIHIFSLRKWCSEFLRTTSLVMHWIRRICLPMQGTWVWSLVRENVTCHGATKPYATVTEPTSGNSEPTQCNRWAHVHDYWSRMYLQPALHNKRSHHNEKPMHHNEEEPPLTATRESHVQQQRPRTAQNK